MGSQPKTVRGGGDKELLGRTDEVVASGNRVVPICPIEMEGGPWSVVPSVSRSRKNRREMRPAAEVRPCPPKVMDGPKEGVKKTQVRPLSVEAGEFSPKTESKARVATRARVDKGLDDFLSRTGPGEILNRRDAVELTTAVAGAATLAKITGPVASADPTGTDVPAIAEMRFLAVAEVYSSAVDVEGDPSIIHTDGQHRAVVSEEKDRSHPLEHSGVDQLTDPIGGSSDLEPLEHSVPKVPLNREGESSDSCRTTGVSQRWKRRFAGTWS